MFLSFGIFFSVESLTFCFCAELNWHLVPQEPNYDSREVERRPGRIQHHPEEGKHQAQ